MEKPPCSRSFSEGKPWVLYGENSILKNELQDILRGAVGVTFMDLANL